MKINRILITLLTAGLLSACSQTAPPATSAPTATSAATAAAPAGTQTLTTAEGSVATNAAGLPVGQASLGQPDLFGEIKDIIGNEVTLLLLENPLVEEGTRVPGSGMGQGQGGAGVAREYTGEETTLLIPVGTTMVRRVPQSGQQGEASGTGTGPVEEAVGLNQLTKGSALKIYYYEGRDVIEKIVVQSPLP